MASGPNKSLLVQQLRSSDESAVKRALEELRKNGWLEDGTLQGADLDDAHLEGANLSRANLSGAILIGANLRNAHLDEVDFEGVGLREADMRGAFLNGVNLTAVKLFRTNLQGADLSSATLVAADLNETILDGALLYNANLENATNLLDKQLAMTYAMWSCTLPDGSHYEGRYQLAGDLAAAQSRNIELADSAAMARFYEVDEERYDVGQQWARDTLLVLRDETEYDTLMDELWNADE